MLQSVIKWSQILRDAALFGVCYYLAYQNIPATGNAILIVVVSLLPSVTLMMVWGFILQQFDRNLPVMRYLGWIYLPGLPLSLWLTDLHINGDVNFVAILTNDMNGFTGVPSIVGKLLLALLFGSI